VIRYNSFAASSHAVGQMRKENQICRCPLLSHLHLQLLHVSRVPLLHSPLEVTPQILYRIEIRRVGREVHALHSIVKQPSFDDAGGVLGIIVLLKPPRALREETMSRGKEMCLEDSLRLSSIQHISEDLNLTQALCQH